MACENNRLRFLLLLLLGAACRQQYCVDGHWEPEVPCFFIFGDSLSDCGNNNALPTAAKTNYFPYGIDFPAGPTGRFTNGRTAVDILSQIMGFENFIPPFANTSGSDILKGVNYASGAAGIRKETGTQLGPNICLGLQLANHRAIVSQIATKLGNPEKARDHLNKCLYYVNIGSNDYLNNYFLPQHFQTSRTFNPVQYADALIQEYSLHLRALHELGSRKFAVVGLHYIGCILNEVIKHGKNGSLCVDEENKAALIFNEKLKALVDQFNKEIVDAKFIFVNSAVMASGNLALAGLKNTISGCCQVREDGQCVPNQQPCEERKLHAFWDSFHPTEIVNEFTARSIYRSPVPTYTHPMDISSLVTLRGQCKK